MSPRILTRSQVRKLARSKVSETCSEAMCTYLRHYHELGVGTSNDFEYVTIELGEVVRKIRKAEPKFYNERLAHFLDQASKELASHNTSTPSGARMFRKYHSQFIECLNRWAVTPPPEEINFNNSQAPRLREDLFQPDHATTITRFTLRNNPARSGCNHEQPAKPIGSDDIIPAIDRKIISNFKHLLSKEQYAKIINLHPDELFRYLCTNIANLLGGVATRHQLERIGGSEPQEPIEVEEDEDDDDFEGDDEMGEIADDMYAERMNVILARNREEDEVNEEDEHMDPDDVKMMLGENFAQDLASIYKIQELIGDEQAAEQVMLIEDLINQRSSYPNNQD